MFARIYIFIEPEFSIFSSKTAVLVLFKPFVDEYNNSPFYMKYLRLRTNVIHKTRAKLWGTFLIKMLKSALYQFLNLECFQKI